LVKIIPSSVLDRSIDQERLIASVMELVDVPDSKSDAFISKSRYISTT